MQLWVKEIRSLTRALSLPWPAANHIAFLCPVPLQGAISHGGGGFLLGKIVIVKKIILLQKLLACKKCFSREGLFFLQMWHSPGNLLRFPSTALWTAQSPRLKKPTSRVTQQVALGLGPLGFHSRRPLSCPWASFPIREDTRLWDFYSPIKYDITIILKTSGDVNYHPLR